MATALPTVPDRRAVAPVLQNGMPREITQRELRNESGQIMRALDRGETFIVTRNGVAVGRLTPIPRQRFVASDAVATMFSGAPPVDLRRLREDLDQSADAGIRPRT